MCVILTETIKEDLKKYFDIESSCHENNNSKFHKKISDENYKILKEYLKKDYEIIEKSFEKNIFKFLNGLKKGVFSISKMGDKRATIDATYLASFDAVVNYNLPLTLKLGGIEMNTFIEGGTGYTWFGKERSHTLNGGYGVNIPVSEKISIKINSTYKHAFNDMQDLKAHFQHNVGVAINFGGKDSWICDG